MKQTKPKGSALESFKLYYEELERKPVKTVPTKKTNKTAKKEEKSLKEKLLNKLQLVSSKFNNIKKKLSQPRKKAKKLTKAEREIAKIERNHAILGIGQLLVVVSIAYSTSVIFIGVDSLESKIILIPQVVFALFTLLKAFSKLYK